jgi:hypothetical protein
MALQTLGLGAGSLAVLGAQGADSVALAVPMLLNELRWRWPGCEPGVT